MTKTLRKTLPITISLIAVFVLTSACTSATTAPTPTPTPEATHTITPSPMPPTATPTPAPLSVVEVEDVRYLTPLAENAQAQVLDIYAPETASGDRPWPVVIFAHGYRQSKRALATVSREIAAEGAVVFTPDWFTDPSSAATWRQMQETLVCAVQFARAEAPAYHGDPSNVTLVGFSMGGGVGAQVAIAQAAINDQWDAYARDHDGPPPQVACDAAETAVQIDAFIGIGGAYTLPDRFETTDPDLWAMLTGLGEQRDLIIRLLQGEFDSTVPPETADIYYTRLIEAGFNVELIPYDSGHTVPRDLTVETVIEITQDRP